MKKRCFNPELLIDPNGVLPHNLQHVINGKKHLTYEIKWTGTSQASEELGTAAALILDGTTTPFALNIVSSENTLDKRSNAAGAAHSVAAFGISVNSITGYNNWVAFGESTPEGKAGRPQSTVEVMAVNGTTDVLSTRMWIWVDAGYVCEWGTGQNDAEGNITLESPPNTTLILITAGQNEGEGGVIHFPPGVNVRVDHADITPIEALAAASGLLVSATYTSFDQALNTGPDLDIDYYTYITPQNTAHTDGREKTRFTTIASKVLWKEATITAAKDFDLNIVMDVFN